MSLKTCQIVLLAGFFKIYFMKKTAIVLGFMAVIVLFSYVLFTGKKETMGELDSTPALDGTKSDYGFKYVNGLPWIQVKIAQSKRWVLFDTGTARTSIDESWLREINAKKGSDEKVVTAVGIYETNWAEVNSLEFAGKSYHNTKVLAQKTNTSILGSDLILQLPNLIINKSGISYNKEVTKNDPRVVECVQASVDLAGNSLDTQATALYLHLKINNKVQPVLLDTGIDALLLGTFDDEKPSQLLPEVPHFARVKALGEKGSSIKIYYKRHATLNVGGQILTTKYNSFPSRSRNGVRYFLGAKFLNYYSLYVDYRHGHVCLLRTESAQ